MRPENVKEYELVRNEMVTVKECITKYVGYVLGGSGAGVYGIASLAQGNLRVFEIAYICFALSTIMSFVLLVLFYKFSSHNRFAGYCKLLNHENYDVTGSPAASSGTVGNSVRSSRLSAFSWEIALEWLRASDMNPATMSGVFKDLKIQGIDAGKLGSLLSYYVGKSPSKDRKKFGKGLRILGNALTGRIRTRSWGFPPIVASIFFLICWAFLVAGLVATWRVWRLLPASASEASTVHYGVFIAASLALFSHSWLWFRFIGKLHCLMGGTSTIDGFFWRFLPVRAAFLNALGITPTYVFVADQLDEEIQALNREYGGVRDA